MKLILKMEIRYEHDVVLCRQRARQIAEVLLYEKQDQTRIATAVSEIARNAFEYAGGGKLQFLLAETPAPSMVVVVTDSGRGIQELESVLSGHYSLTTGLGMGILGAKRLMDRFEVSTPPTGGTQVLLGKLLPKKSLPLSTHLLHDITEALAKTRPQNPFEEIQQQNQELLRALEELRARQTELAESHRGITALYSELDEKAHPLKRASQAKTSFLANLTHEFRTPLNSIMSLTKTTLSEEDATLHPEHKKQLTFVRKSAETLSDLVNDILDVAKVEAGRTDIHVIQFEVAELFSALRGALRPLLNADSNVTLLFEMPLGIPHLSTDQGKCAQILRNLISNALKFTERGQIRVTAVQDSPHTVRFDVTDSGIGISPEDHAKVFEEFIQIQNPLQKKFKGTGLGLSLSRALARLLGGEITLESQLGMGSTFSLVLPMTHSSGNGKEKPDA